MPTIASFSPRVLASVGVKNIQPPSIYATNLVVHLDAGNTTSYIGSGTTWTDLSGNLNNFILKKGQTSSSSTQVGPTYFINNSNYGMQFAPGGTYDTVYPDGANGQWLRSADILSTDAILNNYSTGTIEFWLKTIAKTRALDFRDGDGGTYINGVNYSHCLTSRQRNGVYSHAIFSIGAYCNSSGAPAVGTAGKLYWHATNSTVAQSTANISDNTVYQVVVTFSGTNCKFYINGALDSTTSGNYSVPSSGGNAADYGTCIGVWPASGYNEHQFSGSIYNVKIYNAQLNDSQVLQNYRAVKGRFGF
jgi:hypothetical protein